MQKSLFSLFLTIILLSLLLFNCQKKSDTIATVGKFRVTATEMLQKLKREFPDQYKFKDVDMETKKGLLGDLIFDRLKTNEALELGLDKEDTFQKTMNEKLENLMLYRYYEVYVVDNFVTDDDVYAVLKEGNIELRASHILIKYDDPKQEYKRSKEEAETLAKFVSNEAKRGEDFNHLVRQYSDDIKTKDKNGDLGYFKYGKMEESFQKAVWEMEIGEISDPVETKNGFHIIRLDDRTEATSFGNDRQTFYRVKQQLFSKHIPEAQKLADSLYIVLQKKYSMLLTEDNIKTISESIKKLVEQDQMITDKSFTDEEKSLVLAEWDSGQVTIKTLVDRLGYRAERIVPQLNNERSLKDYVKRLVNSKLFAQDAISLHFENDNYIKEELEKFKQNTLANIYDSRYIRKNIPINDSDVEDYYNNNKEEFKNNDGEIPPMEKIKPKIKSHIRKYRRKKNKDDAEKMLHEKYDVQIDEKVLAEL